ncbi:PAS domain-containing protein [Breoghania sp. L-A4]|uniref:PAS domain-containing protein n=1 Tax=Breoghania sp. L-A4 TaxID=2304600 RepID=UPI000E358517|nr:PAS domain-containing protein [Breoghania sp. L-A4]AXS38890.1 PAS domain-containing protein [Breoghania sp. L-A4]
MPLPGQQQAASDDPGLDAEIPGLDSLLATLRIAQWHYDPNANTLTWKQSFGSGADRHHPTMTEPLAAVLERYTPDHRPDLLAHFETALLEGHSGPSRFAVFTRTGDQTFIESVASRVEGPDGRPHVKGIYRNCASDVGTELSLREFMGLLGKMTTASRSAIILIDSHGGIRSVNSAFCKTFRLPADHGLVGRNIRNVPGRLGKGLVSTLVPLLEMGNQDVKAQKRFILPDGTELMLQYRVFRFGAIGRPGGLLFKADLDTSGDVDMGALFDHLPTPMVAIQMNDHRIVATNAMARRFFGLRKEHLMEEDITRRILSPSDMRTMMNSVSSLGIENGHVCQISSVHGDTQTYRLRALPYSDNDRRLLIIEFHISAKDQKAARGGTPAPHRKGLLKRVVQHLDF